MSRLPSITEGQCPELVSDGQRSVSFHRCGRPIKRNGLCGLHAAAKERRAKRDQEWQEARVEQEVRRRTATEALSRLGVDGDAHYSSIGHVYTGKVVVSVEELERAIAEAYARGLDGGQP